MQYLILEEETEFDLSDTVNEYINLGWRPQGGVSVYHNGGMHAYYQQAMIKGN